MPTKVFDTHNAYNTSTGLYTVPVSGKYRATANFIFNVTDIPGSQSTLSVYRNGGVDTELDTHVGVSSSSVSVRLGGSIIIQCNAGDTLNFVGAFSISGVGQTTGASTSDNYMSFERIGN